MAFGKAYGNRCGYKGITSGLLCHSSAEDVGMCQGLASSSSVSGFVFRFAAVIFEH